jgi:hypothetical protein
MLVGGVKVGTTRGKGAKVVVGVSDSPGAG